MELNAEQTQAVRQWVGEGAGISDVQKKLSELFGISMTYMEVRFLIDDLDAELVDSAPEQENIHPQESQEISEDSASSSPDVPFESDASDENIAEGAGEVRVTVSPIQRPDCLAFGDVVFSDNSKAEWYLDRMGQLGLKQEDKTKPIPEADIPVFQRKLQEMLSKMFG